MIKIFTVYDEKAEAYLQPFYMKTTAEAQRAIADCANDENHNFCRHASDYTLFELGTFDESTANFDHDKKSLGCVLEYKKTSIEKLKVVGGDE